jgi:hypothetical protein
MISLIKDNDQTQDQYAADVFNHRYILTAQYFCSSSLVFKKIYSCEITTSHKTREGHKSEALGSSPTENEAQITLNLKGNHMIPK